MKKIYILSLFTVGLFTANAQNVGIGTTNPETKLQVEGALSLKPSSGTATAGSIEIPTDVSVFRIADDATNTAITVTSASPKEGQSLTIYNSDANTATFYGNAIAPNSGVISCTYVNGAWRLVSDNSASGNNFIKNQTGAQSGANFNISGNGTIGGNLTTTGAASLNGGATVSGATNINTSGSSITNIGTGTNTGAITLGNSSNNINLPKLNASSIVRTDASKNLTTGAVNLNSADVTGTLPVGNLPNLNGDVTGAINSNTIANNAVNSAKIADGSIVNADINAAAAIADTKLATISTAGKVLNSATTATSTNTASAIVARDASGNFSAGLINANLNGQWQRIDDRTIAPSDITSGFARFGFTSWANNNSAPYADFLHLRSYTDASGGNDNLIMFRKDAIGMRIYQQSFNSATAYSSYKDVAFTSDLTGAVSGTTNYVSKFTDANTLGNSQIYDNGTSVGIGLTNSSAKLHISSANQTLSQAGNPAGGLLWIGGKNNTDADQYINFRNPSVGDGGVTGMAWWSSDILFGRYRNEAFWAFKETHGGALGGATKDIMRAYITDAGGYQNLNRIDIAPNGGDVRFGADGVYGKFRHVSHHNHIDGTNRNANEVSWFPADGGETDDHIRSTYTSPGIDNRVTTIAPYNGRLLRIMITTNAGNGGGGNLGTTLAYNCKIVFDKNNSTGGTLTNFSPTLVSGSQNQVTTYEIPSNFDCSFNKGDKINIGFALGANGSATCNNCRRNSGSYIIVMVWEYDIQD